jgi:hypothetical protein
MPVRHLRVARVLGFQGHLRDAGGIWLSPTRHVVCWNAMAGHHSRAFYLPSTARPATGRPGIVAPVKHSRSSPIRLKSFCSR